MRIEFIERLKAEAGGYFWIPCPNCGRMFGGHEKGGEVLWENGVSGRITCSDPECKNQVRSKNKDNGLPDWGEEK